MLEGLHSSSLGQSCAWASPSGTGGAASRTGKAVFGGAGAASPSLLRQFRDESFPLRSLLGDVGGSEELQQRLRPAPEVSLAQSLRVADDVHPTVIAVLLGRRLLLQEGCFAPSFAQEGVQLPRHLLGVDGVAFTVGIIMGEAFFVPEINQ